MLLRSRLKYVLSLKIEMLKYQILSLFFKTAGQAKTISWLFKPLTCLSAVPPVKR